MILKTFTKQPADVKDYDVLYADWLGETTDTLTSVATPVVTCLTDSADTALVVRGGVGEGDVAAGAHG